VGLSGLAALDVMAVLVSFGKPGIPTITDPPFTGVDAVAFVVGVEGASVPESLSVILEALVETEYSGSMARGDRT